MNANECHFEALLSFKGSTVNVLTSNDLQWIQKYVDETYYTKYRLLYKRDESVVSTT